MAIISEFVTRQIAPEHFDRREALVSDIIHPIQPKSGAKRHTEYEAEVFNYLLENMKELGIKRVLKFKNLLMDGAIILVNEKRMAVEIKLRMNWEKAWSFATFQKNLKRRSIPYMVALFSLKSSPPIGEGSRPAECLRMAGLIGTTATPSLKAY